MRSVSEQKSFLPASYECLNNKVSVLPHAGVLFAAGSVHVCLHTSLEKHVPHTHTCPHTEAAAPCLGVIMWLVICAISSDACRQNFKLRDSVCLEYLLMTAHHPPAILPVPCFLPLEVGLKCSHLFGHVNHCQCSSASTTDRGKAHVSTHSCFFSLMREPVALKNLFNLSILITKHIIFHYYRASKLIVFSNSSPHIVLL